MIEGGGGLGWTDPMVLVGFGLFAASAVGFILVESRSQSPMLPLHLFEDRTFSSATVIGWVTNVVFYGLIFVLSLFFQRTQGYTALQTGLAFLPMTAIILPADLASGRITTLAGARLPIVVGQILMMVGCITLVGVRNDTLYWRLAIQLLLIGAGIGLTVPAMTSSLLGTVDKTQSGIASGVLNAARQAGSVVGVALFGTFIAEQDQIVSGLRLLLLLSAGMLLLSTLLGLSIPPRLPAQVHGRSDTADSPVRRRQNLLL
jgi:MFS transporter, DHA2 family, methylenomycin A resistance protein